MRTIQPAAGLTLVRKVSNHICLDDSIDDIMITSESTEYLSDIRTIVDDFRFALEKCERRSLSIGLQDFPAGACGDVSLILGHFLLENGFQGFDYVLGELLHDTSEVQLQSHAWLQFDSIVVDITADQFNDVDEKVIVRYNSKWHERWNGIVQHKADIRIFDEYTAGILMRDYMVIISHYNNLQQSQ